jgi:hypothetical protein
MIVGFETKYNKKGFWCDDCGNEWVIKWEVVH